MSGKIYICPTPIGNLEDITLRALRVLKEADIIGAEDTRITSGLLRHFDIKTPLTSYHEHNERSKGRFLIDKALEGQNVAIVSDAGMPGISDPGHEIIKMAIEEGVEVEVLPGACAFVTALVGSAMENGRFTFFGFLSRDKGDRRKELEKIKSLEGTLILYESPHRIKKTLRDMLEILGNRRICACRELTKRFEEFIRSDIEGLIEIMENREIRGEFVLIIDALKGDELEAVRGDLIDESADNNKTHRELVEELINQGISKKEAIKRVAKLRGVKKDEVYREVYDL